MKVLVTAGPIVERSLEKLLQNGFEIVHCYQRGPALKTALRGISAWIFAGFGKITPGILAEADDLKIITFFGTQPETFFPEETKKFLQSKGIILTRNPGVNAQSVAEMTIGLIINLARKTTYLNRELKNGNWRDLTGQELQNKTLGIIGMGEVGTRVAKIASCGLGMKIIYWSPHQKNVPFPRLEPNRVLQEADVVSLHLALTPETENFISYRELFTMKASALLINTARAKLVDPNALRGALKSAIIAGAAFDGYYIEPLPGLEDDRYGLLQLPDDLFLVLPHKSFDTAEANERATDACVEKIIDLLIKRATP